MLGLIAFIIFASAGAAGFIWGEIKEIKDDLREAQSNFSHHHTNYYEKRLAKTTRISILRHYPDGIVEVEEF